MAAAPDNIFIVLQQKVQEHPDREALVSYDENLVRQALTFQQLWTLSARCASFLREHGLRRHDTVMITAPVSLEYYVISFGIMMAGGAPVPMKKLEAEGKALAETVKVAHTGFLVLQAESHDTTWSLLRSDIRVRGGTDDLVGTVARNDMPLLRTAFLVRRKQVGKTQSFMNMLKSRQEEYVDLNLRPTDACCTVLTMNQEKLWRFKVVEITHKALLLLAKYWAKKFPHFKSYYIPYPWYGAPAMPLDILCGETRIIPDQWATGSHLEAQVKMMGAFKVENSLVALHDVCHVMDSIKDGPGPFVDTVIVTGGLLSQDTVDQCNKFARTAYVSYSSSECLFITIHKLSKGEKYENFLAGKLEENIQIKILNKKQKDLTPGQMGEIAIKSNRLFTRYLGEPEMNRKVWTRDGWFLTNDGGFLRADGNLFVVGRQGEIISRGIMIFMTAILERPISEHPDVLEVKVVPVPDPINGQNSCACVMKRPESDLSPQDIIALTERTMTDAARHMYTLDHVVMFEDSVLGKSKEALVTAACLQLGRTLPA